MKSCDHKIEVTMGLFLEAVDKFQKTVNRFAKQQISSGNEGEDVIHEQKLFFGTSYSIFSMDTSFGRRAEILMPRPVQCDKEKNRQAVSVMSRYEQKNRC